MRLLLLSNAKCEGMGYLEHAREHVRDFLGGTVPRVLFVPFAAVTRSYDDFVGQTLPVFDALGVAVEGIHRCTDPVAAVNEAPALMIGGGNTWKLLRELRSQALLPAIRARVERGMPYIGWSAGSNVACPTIMTTNDMPICDPHGFDALGLVPFQINPHYLHGNPPGFKGETREERISTSTWRCTPTSWSPGCAKAPRSASRTRPSACSATPSAGSSATGSRRAN